MGAELTTIEDAVRIPPWLDEQTASLVRAIVAEAASRYPDLRAALLFGSVARHEERPLTDAEPSDVDLLLLFDLEPHLSRLPYNRLLAIYEAVARRVSGTQGRCARYRSRWSCAIWPTGTLCLAVTWRAMVSCSGHEGRCRLRSQK